jgi:hypothetical protein
MAPKAQIPGGPQLSIRQTRALRFLALGGAACPVGTKIRFTHPEGGVHIELSPEAVRSKLVEHGLVWTDGDVYRITPAGTKLSDRTAEEYRMAWLDRRGKGGARG